MSIRDTLERVRVSADFTDADGRRLAGSYSTRIDSRLTSTEGDDTIIPAGIVPSACGHLSTDDRRRSLDIRVPATDDPEIREDGWRVIITVVFCGRRGSETYVLEDIPAGSEINLADVVPIVFPEGGQVPTSPVIIHGEDGVGIEDITYDAEASALVFHLTDGTTTEVELPGASQPGEPGGRGIESITAEGTTATVTYTDGDTDTFELPRGLQGEPGRDGVDGEPGRDGVDGRGVEGITAEDTTATVTYTDGGTGTFELPRGPQGEPGSDGSDGAPGSDGVDGRGIESVTAADTTATVTYTDGSTGTFELPRGPQGTPGRDGVDGAPGDPGRDGSDGAPGSDGVDGRGIESVTAEGTTATVSYTDGGTGTFELPRGPQGEPGRDGAPGSDGIDGAPGEPGRGIESIAAEGTTATVSYTDGGTGTFELPRGLQGEPGRDGADGAPGEPGRDGVDGSPGRDGEPGRGIQDISAADTTATVIYTDGGTGTFELPRGLQGEPGEKGDPGEPGKDGADVAYSSGTLPEAPAGTCAGTTGSWVKWGRLVMLTINLQATKASSPGTVVGVWRYWDLPEHVNKALLPDTSVDVSARINKSTGSGAAYHNVHASVKRTTNGVDVLMHVESGPIAASPSYNMTITYIAAE